LQQKYFLHDNWKFSIIKKENIKNPPIEYLKYGQWLNASVPGTIHTDLLASNLIPEPFYSDNENKLQWIGEFDWSYKTTFNLPKNFEPGKQINLVFEGLDTVADLFLNDEKIGTVNNMFLKHTYEVAHLLRKKNNKLEVNFVSAENYAKKQEKLNGKLPVALRSERVHIRKAQYSFGWDWGPTFITMGIWRSVYLQQPDVYSIEDLTFDTLSISESKALVRLKAGINKPFSSGIKIIVSLSGTKSKYETAENATVGSNEFQTEFEINNPVLWYPNGLGSPHLYNLEIQIIKDKVVLDRLQKKVGIRVVILQLSENSNSTFQFIVNGEPVYLKGCNWIPADSFLPRVCDEKYRSLLLKAKEANMNVIRVWGGGIYENDVFYDLCDEFGLIVWQDFMFACAAYPENESFLNNVAREVAQNILRLQFHPSIAIWCGNNENEWVWFQAFKSSYKKMPGYKIYHVLIPGILKKLDPNRPYWQSTPFGNEDDPNSVLSGNTHQWDMWSRWLDYKYVKSDRSLFVTEFGFQSPANYESMLAVLPEDQRNPQSRIFEYHNKQVEGPERLFKFLSTHLPVKMELKDFIYLTQLNQALGLKECVEYWQSRFPKTNGSIIWQLNDCWQVSSWSLIDSNLMPKLSYYFVKRSFLNQFLGFIQKGNNISAGVVNNGYEYFTGICRMDIISSKDSKIRLTKSKKILINRLSKQEIFSIFNSNELKIGDELIVITLEDKHKNIIHRNLYSGVEFKYLKLPEPRLRINERKNEVIISSDKLTLFVALQSNGKIFEDNGFIIMPGEKMKIKYAVPDSIGKSINPISVITLNQYLQ
jgi:beta-mannosidase